MDLDLKDKVALITGGSRGIGLATARALAWKNTPARATASLEPPHGPCRCWWNGPTPRPPRRPGGDGITRYSPAAAPASYSTSPSTCTRCTN